MKLELSEFKSSFHEVGLLHKNGDFFILKSYNGKNSEDYTGSKVSLDSSDIKNTRPLESLEIENHVFDVQDLKDQEEYLVVINNDFILSRSRKHPNIIKQFNFKSYVSDHRGEPKMCEVKETYISEFDFSIIETIKRNLIFKRKGL